MPTASSPRFRALALAALLEWLLPRGVRGENSVTYKIEDYQELGGRIGVHTGGTYVEKDLGTDSHLKFEYVLDAIAGATPTGVPAQAGSDQVDLTEMHEKRKAWNADLSHQFGRINVAVGTGNSRESDYVSNGWSINTATDFNQKNTTLLLGVAGTDDKIKVFNPPRAPRQRKHTNDLIAGVTQLIDPRTSVSFNLTWGRASGYLSDPYKIVAKSVVLFPGVPPLQLTYSENRPNYREKWIALIAVNHAFPEARGAIDASYRFYHDTFGVDAHTADVAWFQHVTDKLMLRPYGRFYDQAAASFYHYNLDQTSIVPVVLPQATAPFYSSDHRLSALQTYTYGLKAIWNVTEALVLDVTFERYDMRGKDGVTPQSAYSRARMLTGGIKYAW